MKNGTGVSLGLTTGRGESGGCVWRTEVTQGKEVGGGGGRSECVSSLMRVKSKTRLRGRFADRKKWGKAETRE